MDYAEKIKQTSNSPNSSGTFVLVLYIDAHKFNRSVDECYKNRKKSRKKSNRIIINEFNLSYNRKL